jgi:hypothetical protein
MNQGRIENFARPYELLMDSKTILHGLVYSLDKQKRDKLIDLAKKQYDRPPVSNGVLEIKQTDLDAANTTTDDENTSLLSSSVNK